MGQHTLQKGREFLKDRIRLDVNFAQTGQATGVPMPELGKAVESGTLCADLPRYPEWANISDISLKKALLRRQSCRTYSGYALSMGELSFLLWASQGIRERINDTTALRTVPSAGNRHAFESYVLAMNMLMKRLI